MIQRFIVTFFITVACCVYSAGADALDNSDTSSQLLKDKKLYTMGQKVFEKNCPQDMALNSYTTMQELQVALKEKCQPLKTQHFEALSLYLWDLKKTSNKETPSTHISVNEDEKCPVCGMFTYKYPRWAAQIFYMEGKVEKHYSFDGVKDLLKFYFNPQGWGNYAIKDKSDCVKILVTDYYSQKAIDAKKAYYVLGSDAYGPMGNELIPFENEADAKTFFKDHKGSKITQFENITEKEVHKLDE
jgi:nitrous oxide reductase accessory protein NosL